MKNQPEPNKENQVLTGEEPASITKSGGVVHLTLVQYLVKTLKHHVQCDPLTLEYGAHLERGDNGKIRIVIEVKKK